MKSPSPLYRVERKEDTGNWYQVMLSPFETKDEVQEYYQKYSKYYPNTNTSYRVTNISTNQTKTL